MKILLVAPGDSDGGKLQGQLCTLGHEAELTDSPASPLDGHRLTVVMMAGAEQGAAAAIRAVRSAQEGLVPVLACGAMSLDLEELVEAGADDYLPYPCETAELDARLRVIEAKWKKQGAEARYSEVLAGLVGRIAHDYNNLLAAVRGNADLCLLNPGVDASTRYGLEQIKSAAGKAVDLTRQLQIFKQVPAGQATHLPLDLSALIRDAGELLRVAVSRKCQLRYELAQAGAVIRGDALCLKQMLAALVMQASESLGEDGGAVAVRTQVDESRVLLEVQECGPRVDAAVQAIARAHGAKVETGEGARVCCRVAFPKSTQSESAQEFSTASGAARQGVVLLIDSDDETRREARRLLRRAGFAVFEAATGAEGLEVVGQLPAGLDSVVLDVDGPAVLDPELLAAIPRLQPGFRVVVWSVEAEEIARARVPELRDAAFVDRRAGVGELALALERARAT
jgi:DNA-binding response OmpR family regulator